MKEVVKENVELAARRFYSGLWGILVRWFRVPEKPPELPVREGELHESFKPAHGFLGYLKFLFWIGLLVLDLIILVVWVAILIALPPLGIVLFPVALCLVVLPTAMAYVGVHLRFDTTWYVMTDRSLRIRRGIWVIRETTITFENIQNVSVHQGPLQRWFGIANVLVQTAGGGGSGEHGGQQNMAAHAGLIEGISGAEELRNRIMSRLRRSRSTGLGDEAVGAGGRAAWSSAHVGVLAEIRDGLRELLPKAAGG